MVPHLPPYTPVPAFYRTRAACDLDSRLQTRWCRGCAPTPVTGLPRGRLLAPLALLGGAEKRRRRKLRRHLWTRPLLLLTAAEEGAMRGCRQSPMILLLQARGQTMQRLLQSLLPSPRHHYCCHEPCPLVLLSVEAVQ